MYIPVGWRERSASARNGRVSRSRNGYIYCIVGFLNISTALSGGWRSHTAMRQQASVVGYWFQVCSKPHEVIWVESISVVPSMVRSRSRVAGCQHQQMFGWGWVWGQCSKNPRVKSLSLCIFIVTVWVDLQVGSVWDFYC